MMLYIDPLKLESHEMSPMDVVRSINQSNLIVPAASLIYLANDEGPWILKRTFAPDKELDESYGHYVTYQ